MRNCTVPNCKSRLIKGWVNRKDYSFPKAKWLREQWVQAVVITCGPGNHSNVCSDHFKINDYNQMTNYGKFLLISDTLEKYSPIPGITVCMKKDSLRVTLFTLHHQNMNFTMIEFLDYLGELCLQCAKIWWTRCIAFCSGNIYIWDKPFRDSSSFLEKYQSQKK